MWTSRIDRFLGKSVPLAAAGTIAGYVGAWLVWNFIYGIGGRVVSDEQYSSLLDDVPRWGAAAGAGSGLALGQLPKFYPFVGFAVLHVAALMNGAAGGTMDWRSGLVGYLGTHAVAMIGCMLLAAWLTTRERQA